MMTRRSLLPERQAPAELLPAANDVTPRQQWVLAALTAAVMLLIVWVFSPRFIFWGTLGIPEFRDQPEVHRATYALLQLDHPFMEIEAFSNRVLEWRLLFPIIFNLLRLPPQLYLALPWIGCLLVLGYVARIVWRRTHRLPLTAAAMVVVGTTSWFFTSTGWLTYFDSWYVFGALVIAFASSPWAVLIAAVLTPWIDERIVFMLPACLAARAAVHWQDTGRLPGTGERQVLAAAVLPLAAYAAIRVAAVLWFDAGSREYVDFVQERIYPIDVLASGTWMGMRLAWVPVIALPFIIGGRCRVLSAAVAIVTALTLCLAIIIAGDVSRSMSMLIPLAVAGTVLLAAARPDAERLLLLLAAGNLLLPAAHVVTSFTKPIFTARYELHQLESPPDYLDVELHLRDAVRFVQAGDTVQAGNSLRYARKIARGDLAIPAALVAFADSERAAGRHVSAAFFYRHALEAAPIGWPQRAKVEASLAEISGTPP